jgi:hypothetical protein
VKLTSIWPVSHTDSDPASYWPNSTSKLANLTRFNIGVIIEFGMINYGLFASPGLILLAIESSHFKVDMTSFPTGSGRFKKN